MKKEFSLIKIITHCYYLGFILLLFQACDTGVAPEDEKEAEAIKAVESKDVKPPEVATITAAQASFPIKTITTGKLTSGQQAELKFQTSGLIESLPIKEGDYVKKGNLIASLDDTLLQFQVKQAYLTLEDAISKKQDGLGANGGIAGVDSAVSKKKLEIINMMSGYNKALFQIDQARYELERAKVYAPFNGLIAELEVDQYQTVNAGEKICRLVDPAAFEVSFQLLEQEAIRIKRGQQVEVRSVSNPKMALPASVTTINPIVNEQGLVRITARLKRIPSNSLFEGMNVEVIIRKQIPDQIIIPKSALVLRSGKAVVFTYDPPSQLAKWNYVTVAYENDESIAISEGINKGDLVIYEGSLNLSHDAKVKVSNEP